jgi:carbon storage regulator
MLVLSRKVNQDIVIANGLITIKVIDIRGDKVRIGIDAPSDIDINRKEVYDLKIRTGIDANRNPDQTNV